MRMSVVYDEEKNAPRRFLCVLFACVLAFCAVFIWVNIKLKPLIVSVTEGYARNLVSYMLNSVVREELEANDYEFAQMSKNAEGGIIAVSLNAVETNLFKTNVVLKMRERMKISDVKEMKIPLGNFLPYHAFSGLGPKIPVRFLLLDCTSAEFTESFSEGGINQTLYTVSLRVKILVRTYVPTMPSQSEISDGVPLARIVIVGNVPESYTNVEGATGQAQDIVLDAID